MEVRQEELEIDVQEKRSRQPKRKTEIEEKPAKKKRKFNLIDNWGDEDDNTVDIEDETKITNWLVKDKVTIEGNKDNELELVKKKKLKQLELNFKKTFETTWLEGNTQPVHEGRKKEEIIVKKQTVMRKRNMKITNWLKQKTTKQTSEEDTEHMEWEAVDDEMRIIEEDINEKAREDVERLVESIVTEMVDNTAE